MAPFESSDTNFERDVERSMTNPVPTGNSGGPVFHAMMYSNEMRKHRKALTNGSGAAAAFKP
jgi:hypothetical protein